jgi:putative transposase
VFTIGHRPLGITQICRTLNVPLAAVRSCMARPVTARQLADAALKPLIKALFDENYAVYGRRKMKAALRREHGLIVDHDRVCRLMRELGIRGATRTRTTITTRPDRNSPRAPDHVKRNFTAPRPNTLWVSDFTYVPTWSGFVYVAFIIDVHSRFIVGWRVSASMTTDLVMDALEMAVWQRRTHLLHGVIAHSDAGSQYTSVRYTERLAEIGARPSIGSIGDCLISGQSALVAAA